MYITLQGAANHCHLKVDPGEFYRRLFCQYSGIDKYQVLEFTSKDFALEDGMFVPLFLFY